MILYLFVRDMTFKLFCILSMKYFILLSLFHSFDVTYISQMLRSKIGFVFKTPINEAQYLINQILIWS
jgi:hypothetical protein